MSHYNMKLSFIATKKKKKAFGPALFFSFMAVLDHFLILFEYEIKGWDVKSLVARYCPKGSCLEAQTHMLRFPPTPLHWHLYVPFYCC